MDWRNCRVIMPSMPITSAATALIAILIAIAVVAVV